MKNPNKPSGRNKELHKVIFEPSGRIASVPKGTSIINATRFANLDIESPCGGNMKCGKCQVRIETGRFEDLGVDSRKSHAGPWKAGEAGFIDEEKRKAGFRLACAARVMGDLVIFVPEESRSSKPIVSKDARDIYIENNPAVKLYSVRVKPPTLNDGFSDFECLCKALRQEHHLGEELKIDVFTLRQLPRTLREGNLEVTVSVWMDSEIIRIRPGREKRAYGIAIDVGTSTIVGYLCDLKSMEVVKTIPLPNPQVKFGDDVMSRITYCKSDQSALKRLSDEIIGAVQNIVDQAIQGINPSSCRKNPFNRTDIEDMVIGCNTAMHHILLQIDPRYLGASPFAPVSRFGLNIKARDLGIQINPSSYLFMMPIEAGFVGGENVGVVISEEPHKQTENVLVIDIGTNGELVLGNRQRLLSCSCATGPAFEGAQIVFGMRAVNGAIERISIDPETKEVDYKVIGRDAWRKYSMPHEMKAKGICGSGIMDLLAELFKAGVIQASGAFNKEALKEHRRFRNNSDTQKPEFVLAWAEETVIGRDIVINQRDIRQIQLAKAAIYAGTKIMMRKLDLKKIDGVKIAGSFGSHVDPQKALAMGLFPDCDMERIECIGNAAGDGCRAALHNIDKREEAEWISSKIEYVELTTEPDFQDEFLDALSIPHAKDAFPHMADIGPMQNGDGAAVPPSPVSDFELHRN
ncbi:MAG: DUF4445 domain-containing protein [Deltaproteobacteria bacterium]|nr:DUF4445 domain-containing protein [Deltaproteobacteria bacterium]